MSVSNLSTDSGDRLPSESLEIASTLTNEQKLRIVENRKEALLRKHRQEMEELDSSKLKASTSPAKCAKTTVTPKLIDTGGGFLLNESEMSVSKNVEIPIVNRPPAILPPDQPKCSECGHDFSGSYLLEKFDHPVCDNCRDPKEKHALITKTEAKKNYLLTDVDLEQRGAPLKFILSKNPHNSRWSDMKLYLLLQVEKRALEIWGSEEKLIEELEKKEEKRNKMKQNVYHKKIKALKMSVRSSLYTRSLTESHQHNFDEETYNPTEDTYTRSCLTCSFKETYEKM